MAECDVYLSRDGVPVCIHDSKLDRTTSGTGLVTEKTVAEIQQFDAGTWKGAEFAGERVPTLVELLRLVDGHLRLVIEIKQADIEQQVVSALRQADVAPESVMIFSFTYETVNKIAKIEPLLPTTWLLSKLPQEPAERDAMLRKALQGRVSAIGLSKDHVDPHFVRRAKACGLPVFVWTVNEADTMRTLAAQGVDAIITDRPDLAASVFATGDTPSP
jgi:glycerophosphoryl diester phosphodiesterase